LNRNLSLARRANVNKSPEQTIYGSASSGEFWFFGKLEGKTLYQDPRSFTLTRLDELFAALNYVFHQAKLVALAPH
jgi:hypothetical protein